MDKRVQEFFDRKLKNAKDDDERSKIIHAIVKRCIPDVMKKLEEDQNREFKRKVFNVSDDFGI